jgi:type I restriction enzyme S subunit
MSKLTETVVERADEPTGKLLGRIQKIVLRGAGLFSLADLLQLRLSQARKQADQLTPSLLARAFAGKLISQNPNDKPAKKLLERIKTSSKGPMDKIRGNKYD